MRSRLSARRSAATLAALVAASIAAACGGAPREGPKAEATAPVTVELRVAALEAVPRVVEASGSVEPRARVAPGTKILGRVREVRAREGDRVERGQLLALLERRDLEAALEQAAAAIAVAEAQLDNSRAQHRRMVELHTRGSVTDKNLEDATAAFRVAEASLEQARANHAAAEVMLGYAEVRAPIGGFVTVKHVEAGDMASPGQPLFTLEDLARVKVVVHVAEADVVDLSRGAPAHVRLDVLGETREARVDRVVPAGDPASRTYEVQLALDNPDGRLKSGMFARVAFPRGERRALVVPRDAVVRRGQLEGLFVVAEDARARLRWLRLGREIDGGVEVLAGLSEGERYVLAPPPGLVDAAPVVAR